VDKKKAIASFLDHLNQLIRPPLISDEEMKKLFGDEIEQSLKELDGLNREKQICLRCEKNCCQQYNCEFYAPQLKWCPIFDLRPALCRLHFCEKFRTANGAIIEELSDIYIQSLSFAAQNESARVKFFDIPPFGNCAPQLIGAVSPLVQAVKEGKLDPDTGRQQIRTEAIKYCIALETNR